MLKSFVNAWKWLARRYWANRVTRAAHVLRNLNETMRNAGYNRAQRRQFWRNFVSKETIRDSVIEEMEK
jgi:hypothetical protein